MFEEEAEFYAQGNSDLKDGFLEGAGICKKAADEIIRDLLCLLVTFNDQIVFDDEKQKIKNAEEWLNK